jgi:hypothetical protein
VPSDSKYFNLSENGNTINGFSDEVIVNPHLLDSYNALDFSGTSVKYVGANCQFTNQVFNT